MEFNNRSFNRIATFFKFIEEAYTENPDIKIIGINSRYDRYAKSSYDGNAMRFPSSYYNEDPYYIPIELAISNPDLYAELIDDKNKRFQELCERWKIAAPTLTGVVGKVIISTFDTGSYNPEAHRLWMDDEPDNRSGLKRFFIPSQYQFNPNNNQDEI